MLINEAVAVLGLGHKLPFKTAQRGGDDADIRSNNLRRYFLYYFGTVFQKRLETLFGSAVYYRKFHFVKPELSHRHP